MICIRCKKLLLSNMAKKHMEFAWHMWTNNCFAKDVESHIQEQMGIVIIWQISVELVYL